MDREINYSGTYKYNGDERKLTEIVEIIKESAKCGLLNNSTKKTITGLNNKVDYEYDYSFSDNNKNFKIGVVIPKKLYDVNDLNMYYLEKYVNQNKKKNANKGYRVNYKNKKALFAIGMACLVTTGCFVAKTNPAMTVIDKIVEWDNANFDKEVESWQPYIDKVNHNTYQNDYSKNLQRIKSEESNYDIEDELDTILKSK